MFFEGFQRNSIKRCSRVCFTHIVELKNSSGSGDLPESSKESDENDESGESESGESGEAEYKRNSIPRDNDDSEDDDDDDDSVDSAVENNSKDEDTSDGEQEGSSEHDSNTRGKVITDTMGDIAEAALNNKIERKSDIIHSLPQNTEEAPSSEEETKAASKDKKSGAALKNLFTALADGEAQASGSGEELALKEKSQSTNFVKRVSNVIKVES